MSQAIRTSVILCTYGRARWLAATVASVAAQLPEDGELLVVEQNTPPRFDPSPYAGLAEAGRLRHFAVTPPSLPAARNFGLSRARGEIILFFDDDVELDPGCIAAHLRVFRETDAAVAAGRVHSARSRVGDGPPSLLADGSASGSFDHLDPAWVNSFVGCNMAFRASALAGIARGRTGAFDPSYIRSAQREESDVARRLVAAGHRIRFEPAASLLHHDAPEGGCRDPRILASRAYYHNQLYYTLRHGGFPARLRALWIEHLWPFKNQPSLFMPRLTSLLAGTTTALCRIPFPSRLKSEEHYR